MIRENLKIIVDGLIIGIIISLAILGSYFSPSVIDSKDFRLIKAIICICLIILGCWRILCHHL